MISFRVSDHCSCNQRIKNRVSDPSNDQLKINCSYTQSLKSLSSLTSFV